MTQEKEEEIKERQQQKKKKKIKIAGPVSLTSVPYLSEESGSKLSHLQLYVLLILN